MSPGAYEPFEPARRPGGHPAARPRYRVLVHRHFRDLWESLPARVGLTNAQQFYDHVANTPGAKPRIGSSTILKGKAGRPAEAGFSRVYHYEISGAGRINYEFNDAYTGGQGDPHRVVRILTINLSSH